MDKLTEQEQALYVTAVTASICLGILHRWHSAIEGWGGTISSASEAKLIVLEAKAYEAWEAYQETKTQ